MWRTARRQEQVSRLEESHGQSLSVVPSDGRGQPSAAAEVCSRLMLDKWYRFHEITGEEHNAGYQWIAALRQAYGQYKWENGDVIQGNPDPPGPPTLIPLPHMKGDTPSNLDHPPHPSWRRARKGGRPQGISR